MRMFIMRGEQPPESEMEISIDGSNYSLSSGILPSLGAHSNRRVKLRCFIISPYDRRYRYVHRDQFQFLLFDQLGTPLIKETIRMMQNLGDIPDRSSVLHGVGVTV